MMLTQDLHSSEKSKYSPAKVVIAVVLFVPWVVVDVISKKHNPSLGYALGLFIGVVSGYLLSPGSPKVWVLVLIATAVAISHYAFVPYYSCGSGG